MTTIRDIERKIKIAKKVYNIDFKYERSESGYNLLQKSEYERGEGEIETKWTTYTKLEGYNMQKEGSKAYVENKLTLALRGYDMDNKEKEAERNKRFWDLLEQEEKLEKIKKVKKIKIVA